MNTLRLRAAAIAAAFVAIAPLSHAHNAWLLPSGTVFSKADTVSVDAAVSNDLFVANHAPLRLEGLQITAPDGSATPDMARTSVLTATENGFGKRTPIDEYTRHGRGTKGMIAIQQSERNGRVVAATLVHADDDIMLITDRGVLVRTRVSEIREMGRATQGVTLIGLDEGAKLSGMQRIVENDAQAGAEEAAEEGDSDAATDTTP